MSIRAIYAMLTLVVLAGCAIKQTVDPFDEAATGFEVCIIEDRSVREGFLVAYRNSLRDKGIGFRILHENASLGDCPVVSTYTARWSWDLALYMSYAEIRVYESEELKGEAVFDSRGGGLRLDKWKDAEPKIAELVDQLFPT